MELLRVQVNGNLELHMYTKNEVKFILGDIDDSYDIRYVEVYGFTLEIQYFSTEENALLEGVYVILENGIPIKAGDDEEQMALILDELIEGYES